MTIQECYKAIGGNYEDVLGRLNSETLIRKFTFMFLEDPSYMRLKQALADKNYDRLYEVSYELTELLRDKTGEQPGIPETMEKVTEIYEITIDEIKKVLSH